MLAYSVFYAQDTNINNVCKIEIKNASSCLSFRKKEVHVAFFQVSIIHPKNLRFTNTHEERSQFKKNIYQVKYAGFRAVFFQYFPSKLIITLHDITNNFPLGYTHAFHNYSHILIISSLCLLLNLRCESNWVRVTNLFAQIEPTAKII